MIDASIPGQMPPNNLIQNNQAISNNQENPNNSLGIPSYQADKTLFYRRKIYSYKKNRYKGKDKVTVQILLGKYNQEQGLPPFIFARDKFFYTPHNLRQFVSNMAYIISFPGLHDIYHQKIVKLDLKHVCTYYFRKKRGKQTSMDIKVKDEKTLNDGVFLNDGIINFYLKIIEDEYTINNNNNALIMKSFFYNSLSNQQNQDLSNNFTYPDSCSFIGTKINVFDFKTLIIPICENYHWSLIIVNDIDKMSNLFKNKLEEEEYGYNSYKYNENIDREESCEYPEIFYLDSFFDMNQRRMVIILKYLFYEYQKVYDINCNISNFFLKNFQKIQCYIPDVPKQDNSFDCGIYLLMYAELFLYDPIYFLKNASRKYGNLNNKKEKENEIKKDENDIDTTKNNNGINNNNENSEMINNNEEGNKNRDNSVNNEKDNDEINNEDNNKNFIQSLMQKYMNENTENSKDKDINTQENQNTEQKNESNLSEFNDKEELNSNNAQNQYENNSMNNNESMRDEQMNFNSLRNWFQPELIGTKRIKIKNLISDLAKIEKEVNKNNIEEIIKRQNEIIKKYMEEQKKEFKNYFDLLES